MDRTYNKKLPVSSLTVSRFVDNISSREEIDQAEYYLYKFRHSPNCWYLRDWSVHSWIRQCLKYGASEKALYTLKNKVQYGIFPDDFTFNLLIDTFIKDGDFKSKVEFLKGIHAVFRGMPLFWGRGYLGQVLAVMESVAAASDDIKLSKDTLDYVNDLLQELSSTSDSESSGEESGGEEEKKEDAVDEDDQAEQAMLPKYVSRFKELSSQLESQGKLDPASFQDLVTALAGQNLATAEQPDLEQYERSMQAWEAETRQLIQREKEMREKAHEEKQERLAAMAAAQQE
ncbi:hypothetical protein F2P81_014097 [Scophthalmus maximus]|uniref:Mitochondrial ribosomal protein S27 n=1 Tax=Scophthalmus maximus TaxID=52904 RepID=A0A6A4SSP4_SCOMX|nr:hypothetical protein F2P81_014097 [Scophthalmus maximus]